MFFFLCFLPSFWVVLVFQASLLRSWSLKLKRFPLRCPRPCTGQKASCPRSELKVTYKIWLKHLFLKKYESNWIISQSIPRKKTNKNWNHHQVNLMNLAKWCFFSKRIFSGRITWKGMKNLPFEPVTGIQRLVVHFCHCQDVMRCPSWAERPEK